MKIFKKLFSLLFFLTLTPGVLHALDAGTSTFKLDTITIPFFPVFDAINPKYATVLSWVTYIADVVVILIIIFWIVRILLAGIEGIRSEGDQAKLQEAYKKLQSALIGIGITFLIPILLTLIGFLIGIGSIFNWPKMFSGCPGMPATYDPVSGNRDEGTYEYYFQAYFDVKAGNDPAAYAAKCGLSSDN
ncbi:MAG: hypothetical protein ACMG57_01890 [Candidatus Dojkabacteria bacterium]